VVLLLTLRDGEQLLLEIILMQKMKKQLLLEKHLMQKDIILLQQEDLSTFLVNIILKIRKVLMGV
jgi:hypothetical protein